jgi:hypothetical protein
MPNIIVALDRKPTFVHGAHHVEPFVGRAFGRDALAHFVVENLSAAARQTVESRVFQARMIVS